MTNTSLSKNINYIKDNRVPYSYTNSEMLPESHKSTNASFMRVFASPPLSWTIESSGQSIDVAKQEVLFFNDDVALNKKKNEILSATPVEHLKAKLGINISETADILQITRQTIYDWKSRKAIPSVKNQERINKLIAICKKWEIENLGPIRHLIRQNIWNEYSLYDLLSKDELDEVLIYAYFDKIKAYMITLSKEREQTKKAKEQHGFKQLSASELFEKIKKNSRKAG
jgi:DNA-binding transcriptional regulator YiaG